MNITLSEIGIVVNEVEQRMDENWGEITSRIVLNDEYKGALEGLEEFSHVLIVTYLHEANYNKEEHLQRRPRNSTEMPKVGILSQRAKNRPNPIGITAVKIISVEESWLTVKGLDAINGTPILDIKPYYPHYDKIEGASVPEWVDRLMTNYF